MKEYLKMADVFGADEVTEQKLIGDSYELKSNGFGHICVVNTSRRANLITHAINSHDELVENMRHYKQEAEQWEARAVKEASMVQEFDLEVERLRRQLAYAFMAGWEEGINGMECDEAEVASVEIGEQFAKN